jgi:SagB-type dehydrogenase family enzyme
MVQSGGEVKMGRYYWYCLATLAILLVTLGGCPQPATTPAPSQEQAEVIKLPEPQYDSDVSLEQSLLERRSVRDYSGQPLTLQEISQLTWAAQGLTDPRGFRTAPSAGGLYPLELYIVVGDVEGLAAGVYRYQPDGHQLVKTGDGDKRAELAEAALEQDWVEAAAVDFVFTAVYERTTGKYGERGIRYVHMEVGHAAQNLCLQATALGLGAVTIGAFYDDQISRLLNLPADEEPLYVIPVGRK